jgi:N-acyl-D-aspartate/D-glutamate deacylase
MLDLVLRNGLVVDGTGAPARRADIGVRDGRIVAVGDVEDSAAREIDCDGLVVAPGFIDPHTHYDPQIMWDPAVTPSSLHGVTTVLGGNCGFTIAPMQEPHGEYLIPMLARVEGMPVDALWAMLDFKWDSFGSWLARLDGNVAVNAGFMCGHSTIRRLVMGEDAVGHRATPDQIDAMTRLLHQSLDEGALGFSSSAGGAHLDHEGNPVPSRHASREEFLTLCAALRDHEGTWMEYIPTIEPMFTDEVRELMADMSVAAGGRSLNWNLLTIRGGEAEAQSRANRLAASDLASARGGDVIALTPPEPTSTRLSFVTGFVYDTIPQWREIIHTPPEERIRLLADPAVRDRLRAGAASAAGRPLTDFARTTVSDVGDPALSHHVGRRIGDIAAERNADPLDTLFDITIEDQLRTGFEPEFTGDDEATWQERVKLFRDRRVLVGGSDAGAHVDMTKTFAGSTRFLGEYVRNRGYVSLEEAVQLITDAPARIFGLRERGRLAEGWHADICVFDAQRVDRGPIHLTADLPTGAQRLNADAIGIEHVFVKGVPIASGGELTGETPGTVFRSGRDTETVIRNGGPRS